MLPIVSFETLDKYNCISCHKEQKKINNIKHNEYKKRRMRDDPEFRKRENKRKTLRDTKRRLTDDEWRVRSNKMKRERFKERMKDPVKRKKHQESVNNKEKRRRNSDPIFTMKKEFLPEYEITWLGVVMKRKLVLT